ncbi:MAG: hydrogenase [Kiritimatiellaeota bacterium]|nr:hydrogenase [Kiritimatiellota bacterium]
MNGAAQPLIFYPGAPVRFDRLPRVPVADFRETVIRDVAQGARLAALFGLETPAAEIELVAILAHAERGVLAALTTRPGAVYPALTPDCPQAQGFEREVAEQWGVLPQGHPWLKPLRFHPPFGKRSAVWPPTPAEPSRPGVTDFFQMTGEEIHEVAVGPVHAGIIEPGHFRFQCHGEQVFHLEIALGYQHRGIERALIGGPTKRSIHFMETLAGDTTIGHTTAYAQVLEALGAGAVPSRAQALRAIALELERLANHVGDLGALAGDVGFLPTASFNGRIRGDFLNLTALLCGNRFGRGLIRPGGVAFDLDAARAKELRQRLAQAGRDTRSAVDLLWCTPSVMGRFEQTGTLTPEDCRGLGLVGPVARACGLERDVRYEFPFGVYCFEQIPVSTWTSGDVFARAYVRWLEIQRSLDFILAQLDALPEGPIAGTVGALMPEALVISLTEGWRGEIVHVAVTDAQGRFLRYKVVDPSFHNWMGLALAMRRQPISDFPLCNKSFNLSYCGHDL